MEGIELGGRGCCKTPSGSQPSLKEGGAKAPMQCIEKIRTLYSDLQLEISLESPVISQIRIFRLDGLQMDTEGFRYTAR